MDMYDSSTHLTSFQTTLVSLPKTERDAMRARRDANRVRLKSGLAKADKPAPIGMHSQGSYAMWTMVQDENQDYDIDDGVYFKLDQLKGPDGGEFSALAVRQMVCDALQDDKFSKPPEALKNCVRVYYNEGYHVDVPAYRRSEKLNTWTGKTEYTYELASSQWEQSDPKEVTKWFNQVNTDLSPDSDATEGQFRRVVRLLKKFSRSRPSWKPQIATGFMITKLASEHFVASVGRDDISLRNTMKAIEFRLTYNTTIDHPVLSATITNQGDNRPSFLQQKLSENLVHLEVLDNANCSHAEAMAAWDKVFNLNWFSGLPETKSASAKSQPSSAVVKDGGGRYAASRRKA
jgi:Cyclic GMP-AMP synthase DncV-like, nucleotidyltransferase domain